MAAVEARPTCVQVLLAALGAACLAGGGCGAAARSGARHAPPTPPPTAPAVGGAGGVAAGSWPDGSNRPHVLAGRTLAYVDGRGPGTVTLQPLPPAGSTFGLDARTGLPNHGARVDPRGWVDVTKDDTVIDGYDFDGLGVGNIEANHVTVSRCWFHGIDGQDSWAVWTHDHGPLTGLTLTDDLVTGSSPSTSGPDGLLEMDGRITGVTVVDNRAVHTASFVQFTDIIGDGRAPYVNVIEGNDVEPLSDPSGDGDHLEAINVSSGTGGLLIAGNHLSGPAGQTATIYLCHDSGDVGNITIAGNLLDGSPQYTIYGGDDGKPEGVLIGDLTITANHFAHTDGQNPGGLLVEPGAGDPRVRVGGNVWYPSGTPIPGY